MTSAAQADSDIRLELEGISKTYPSVIANDDVSLAVRKGEIHAVLGEDGAGKSTLMKVIYGVVKPDSGQMKWEGEVVRIDNPAQARDLGIGMALQVSEAYGLSIDPRRAVHTLSVGEKQRVEIIRCLLQNPKLLIMDEPTSVLTPQAVRKLFDTLRRLAAEGRSILYISHKLDEIQALCHTATVLRDGRVSGDCIPAQETAKSMAKLMIGRELPIPKRSAAIEPGDVRLRLEGLSKSSRDPFGTELRDIELELRAGEILGIAGVSGNGQRELLFALSGEETIDDARAVAICGKPAGRDRPDRRRGAGMGFVPEERLGRGAVPAMSLSENALLTAHRAGMLRRGLIRFDRVAAFARRCIERFDVRCGGEQHAADSLSGGNLQKFIVGREILLAPKLLVVAQPTWGVDVGAAAFIRQQLIDLRNQGAAILVVSDELEELFEIADRIAVIARGRLSPTVALAETSVDEIGLWMSGMWNSGEAGRKVTHAEA